MLTRIKQLALPATIAALLWTTGILVGGDYLHHEIHHHAEHSEEEVCSWHWLLSQTFAGITALTAIFIVCVTFGFRASADIPFSLFVFTIPPSRAPPALS